MDHIHQSQPMLGKTADNTWLQKWKERVGEEEAARVSKEATDRESTSFTKICRASFQRGRRLERTKRAEIRRQTDESRLNQSG